MSFDCSGTPVDGETGILAARPDLEVPDLATLAERIARYNP